MSAFQSMPRPPQKRAGQLFIDNCTEQKLQGQLWKRQSRDRQWLDRPSGGHWASVGKTVGGRVLRRGCRKPCKGRQCGHPCASCAAIHHLRRPNSCQRGRPRSSQLGRPHSSQLGRSSHSQMDCRWHLYSQCPVSVSSAWHSNFFKRPSMLSRHRAMLANSAVMVAESWPAEGAACPNCSG
jgi:hypothetical protein